jgi:hypothetical protein
VTSGDISVTNVTNLPVGSYNPTGTTVSAIGGGANESSIFTVYKFPTTGNVRILYGQSTYSSLSAAVAAIGSYVPNPPAVFSDGIIIGYIAAVKTATDLSNTAQAVFVTTNKFGGVGGGFASSALSNYMLTDFSNVAGTLGKANIDTTATGVQTVSNFFPKGDTRYVKGNGTVDFIPMYSGVRSQKNSIIRQLNNPNAFGSDSTIYIGGIPVYTQRNEVLHVVKNNTGLEAGNETGDIIITNDGRGGARVIAGANGNDTDTLAYVYMAAHGPGELYPNGMDSRFWTGGPKIQNSIEWIHQLNKSATLVRGIDSHKDFYFWNARANAEYIFQYATPTPTRMFLVSDTTNISYVPFKGLSTITAPSFVGTLTGTATLDLPLSAGSGKPLSGSLYLKNSGEAIRTSGSGTNDTYGYWPNASGGLVWGVENSTGGAVFAGTQPYAAVFGHTGAFPVQFATSGTPRLTISGSGAITAANDITVPDEAYGSGWDGSGEVPTKNALYDKIQTLSSGMAFKGGWDASTNTPTLADGVGTIGDLYTVTTGGTALGRTYVTGGQAIYDGSIWVAQGTTSAVSSVNAKVGAVVLDKTDIGLSNVDNTSDATKPVSAAQQSALDLKSNIASPTFTGTTSVSGNLNINGTTEAGIIMDNSGVDKWQIYSDASRLNAYNYTTASFAWRTTNSNNNTDFTGALTASNLSGTNTGDNATNTTSNTYADGKVADNLTASTTVAPSKTAVNTALALKADLASPALTGTPTAPTATAGDNSTKIATTAYADAAANNSASGFVNIYNTVTSVGLTSANWGNYGTLLVQADASAGAITVTLPAASTWVGRRLIVKKIDSSGNVLTIDANGTETIDGLSGDTAIAQWTGVSYVSNGTSIVKISVYP